MTTVYKNFSSTSSLSDIGAMQCAATDGTHIYTTSGGTQAPENNLRLAKYTSTGTLVTFRDTGGDGSGTHTQVNGIFWEPTLNRLFVSSLRNPDPQSWVFEYDTDLNLIRYHTLGAKDMEHIVEHDGYWWAVYHTLHEIEQFSYANNAFTSVAVHSLPGAAPDGETVDNLWQAILWLGNVAYLNVHNENAQSPCINAYEWNGSGFDFVAAGLEPPTANCTQGVTLAPDGVTLYWAERQTVGIGNVVIGGFAEGGTGPLDYLGEKIELARGAFALRRVSSVYTGSAVKVRRDSDDTTQDIGFDAVGDLDEAALLSFVGAGNGYVVTWYNQAQDLTPSSPNTGDLSQATTSKQPQIVGAGVVLTAGQGDRPTVRFTAASSTGLRFADTGNFVQPNWFFAAAGSAGDTAVGRQYVWDGKTEGDGTQYRHLLALDDAGINAIWAGVKLGSAPYTTGFLRHTAVFNGSNSYHRVGGVQKAAGAVGSQSYKLGTIGCNYDGTADFFDGDISEVLWFTGSFGVSSRDLVEIQQGAYFSVPTAPFTADWSEAAQASDAFGSVAHAAAGITESVIAGDSDGEAATALAVLEAQASGNDTLDALAQAAAAIAAGAAAGESWVAQAQVLAELIESASADDAIAAASTSATQSAISEGSTASAAFVAAVSAIAQITGMASASDSFGAASADAPAGEIIGIAAASDALIATVAAIGAVGAGAVAGDSWTGVLAQLLGAVTENVTADALMTARATVSAMLTASAAAGATFTARLPGNGYLIAGAITLTAALSGTVNLTPN